MNEIIRPDFGPCGRKPEGEHSLQVSVLNDMKRGVLYCANCGVQGPLTFFQVHQQQ